MSNSNAPKSPWIVEAQSETFQRDVFDRSRQVPVLVDFWAAWCQPCQMLGPMLEDLATEYGGKFILVKADTEQLSEAAAQFGVQSIPAVYGVVHGEIADAFVGLLPPPQIRAWLDRLLVQFQLGQAERLEAADPEAAERAYRGLIEQMPNEWAAQVGLARLLVQQGRHAECEAVIAKLQERGFLEPEAEKVRAALEMQSRGGGDVERCRAAVQSNPDDLTLQLHLAEALAGSEQYEQALQLCLSLVQKDRHGAGEQARQLMVNIFHLLPDDSELATQFRRKLSMALY